MIIALAGRRPDAPGASPSRFPPKQISNVRERLRTLFRSAHTTELVSSAAAGADLLGLEVAGDLGIVRHIVLPSPRSAFRERSVVDRPGEWAALFDAICDQVEAEGHLHVLTPADVPHQGHLRAALATLDIALALAAERGTGTENRVLAVVVWDGTVRGDDDITFVFREAARQRGIEVVDVPTL